MPRIRSDAKAGFEFSQHSAPRQGWHFEAVDQGGGKCRDHCDHQICQALKPGSGVNQTRFCKKWPKMGVSSQRLLQQSIDFDNCRLTPLAVLARGLDRGCSLSSLAAWGNWPTAE